MCLGMFTGGLCMRYSTVGHACQVRSIDLSPSYVCPAPPSGLCMSRTLCVSLCVCVYVCVCGVCRISVDTCLCLYACTHISMHISYAENLANM